MRLKWFQRSSVKKRTASQRAREVLLLDKAEELFVQRDSAQHRHISPVCIATRESRLSSIAPNFLRWQQRQGSFFKAKVEADLFLSRREHFH